MRKSRNERDDRDRILERLPLSKINMALYVLILVVAVIILYFVVAEYLIYSGQRSLAPLQVNVTKNSAESFGGNFHPVLVVDVATRKESTISVRLVSPEHETYQSSGDPVTNYTSFIILPRNTFSTEFNLAVTAMDKNGRVLTYNKVLQTEAEPEVMFKIQ